MRKLEKLTKKKTVNLRPQGLDRWVINQTQRTLTEVQMEVLRLGLNFAPTLKKIPAEDFAAAGETAAAKLEEEDAQDLRIKVCGAIRKAKAPPPNLSRKQRIAL